MKRRAQLLLLATVAALPVCAERPLRLSELLADPARYDRQVIEISTFVSHGFEDFTLFEPGSKDDARVWVEYGGTLTSETIYCCGISADRQRPAPLRVEDIETKLIQDRQFRAFDRILQSEPETVLHATLRGRFFAGEEAELPGGRRWIGYGHFGLYSLFVIEQVVAVDHLEVKDVDYSTVAEVPRFTDPSCHPAAVPRTEFREAIALQKRADAGDRAWSFTDPARVVRVELARSMGAPVRILRTVHRSPRRIVYEVAGPSGRRHMATVSRPYWLTFFAAKPGRVAWTLLGAVEADCAATQS